MTAGRKVNSISRNWCTPTKYVAAVREMFGVVHLDPCSNADSIVNANVSYCLPQDGLIESWVFPTIYVNPPYGADRERGTTIKDWLRKCVMANQLYNSQVLTLIPVATNTSHWKEYIWNHACAVCFLADTRLKFRVGGDENGKGAPMACAMVYWGGDYQKFAQIFDKFGAVIRIDNNC